MHFLRTLRNEETTDQLESFKFTDELDVFMQIKNETEEALAVVPVKVRFANLCAIVRKSICVDCAEDLEDEPVCVSMTVGGKQVDVNVNMDWKVDARMFRANLAVKGGDGSEYEKDIFVHLTTPQPSTLKVNYEGKNYNVSVLTERQAELSKHMLPKPKVDLSHFTLSPMPGKVIDMVAKVGSKISAGDPLLILEAMKMQNVIKAEKDGVVKAINCAPGGLVEVDHPLIEWEKS